MGGRSPAASPDTPWFQISRRVWRVGLAILGGLLMSAVLAFSPNASPIGPCGARGGCRLIRRPRRYRWQLKRLIETPPA